MSTQLARRRRVTPHAGGVVKLRTAAIAIAGAWACALVAAAPIDHERATRWDASLQSRSDGKGTTTYWGEGASYEIVRPDMTVFFLRRDDGALVSPMIRVAATSAWINVRSVTFTVGERTYGPFDDIYSKPTRTAVGTSLVVESLLFSVDTDEKWRMLDGIAEADGLGRPVIVVFDGETRYGIELDSASKRATEKAVRGFRSVQRH
jgi:hypothetical protein